MSSCFQGEKSDGLALNLLVLLWCCEGCMLVVRARLQTNLGTADYQAAWVSSTLEERSC